MALTVEDGTIVAGANSYCTLAEFKAYHADRANPHTNDDAALSAALIKGTAYVDGKYGHRLKGVRSTPIQRLNWPRAGVLLQEGGSQLLPVSAYSPAYMVIPATEIPDAVKDATCEAAYRALSGPLNPDAGANIKRRKVDVIETEYVRGSNEAPLYRVIDQIMAPLLRHGLDLVRG